MNRSYRREGNALFALVVLMLVLVVVLAVLVLVLPVLVLPMLKNLSPSTQRMCRRTWASWREGCRRTAREACRSPWYVWVD